MEVLRLFPMKPRMRRTLGAALALSMFLPWSGAGAFDFEFVAKRAQDLAERPYQAPPDTAVPRELQELSPRRYRAIRQYNRKHPKQYHLAFFRSSTGLPLVTQADISPSSSVIRATR